MVDLGSMTGGFGVDPNDASTAYSINNSNQVTGYSCTNPGFSAGYKCPFVADLSNAFSGSHSITYKWLPRPNKLYAAATGIGVSINASGCVAMDGDDTTSTVNAFYNGGTVSSASSWVIPMAGPSGTGLTTAINDAGLALCAGLVTAHTNSWITQTATVGGVATSTYICDVPGTAAGATGFGSAINNAATPQVVGYSYANTTDQQNYSNPHAMIWNYGSTYSTTVSAYATALGATNLTGWNFEYASGVNNNGEIVGWGVKGGVEHVFALLNYGSVPEPSTLLLLATGLLGLLAYAWRKRK
jgi:hypothetical protein